MPKPTQADRILRCLEAGHRITALGAFMMFGCNRLAARVYDLRRAGHDIRERRVKTGGGAYVSEYYLVKVGQCELF